MLKNVHKIYFYIRQCDSSVDELKNMMTKWRHKEKIEWCKLCLSSDDDDNDQLLNPPKPCGSLFPPFELIYARYINIIDLHFHRVWSYKCQELILSSLAHVRQNWCDFFDHKL